MKPAPITHVAVRFTYDEVVYIGRTLGGINGPVADAIYRGEKREGMKHNDHLWSGLRNALGVPDFGEKPGVDYLCFARHGSDVGKDGYHVVPPAPTPLAVRIKVPGGADAEHEMIDANEASTRLYRQRDYLAEARKQRAADLELIRQLREQNDTQRVRIEKLQAALADINTHVLDAAGIFKEYVSGVR